MSKFVELFEKYGYIVERFGKDDLNKSYIADNGIYCIPFTEVGSEKCPAISAVSFLSIDKKNIRRYYAHNGIEYIGCEVFSDYMNGLLPYTRAGGVCNHDHALFEIEFWLQNSNILK